MKRFAWQWLAISSVALIAFGATAETRPQYGGTLRLVMHAAPSSLDPGDTSQPDSFARRTIVCLIFERLVATDQTGRVTPLLAQSWQTIRGNQRVLFRLRPGVRFQDGTPLSAEIAASSLRRVHPSWNVVADSDSIVIEGGGSETELLQELALPRNAIVKRDSEDKLIGTGAFQISDWQPGKKLTLASHENCWRGRPFLDEIEISLGASSRDQMMALEMGRADIAESPPDQISRVPRDRFNVAGTLPVEVLALWFTHEAATDDEKTLRQALRLSVERSSMHNVLLQGTGQIAGALIPTWMSGYGFVFPAEADLAKARQLRDSVHSVTAWTLAYDAGDPLARLIAERVALNARDAGLTVRPTTSPSADIRLTQIPLPTSDPWLSLSELLNQIGIPASQSKGHSIEDLYASEQAALATGRIIPLFHLPASYVSQPNVRGWTLRSDGSLDLANAWLKSGQP